MAARLPLRITLLFTLFYRQALLPQEQHLFNLCLLNILLLLVAAVAVEQMPVVVAVQVGIKQQQGLVFCSGRQSP
jgi:hypothetical protein